MDAARYIPPQEAAHRALTMALTAWRDGDRHRIELDDKQPVEVIDKYRRPGQRLSDFEILGEVSGDGGRWYEVKLHLAEPAQVEQVRYVVVGIDPIWVFRQADYEMLAHWDHPMPDDTKGERTQSRAASQGTKGN
jgi:hypothetical protein